jgi:hypothetical protein
MKGLVDQEQVQVNFKGVTLERESRLWGAGWETHAKGAERRETPVTTKKEMMEREQKPTMPPSTAAASFAIFILIPQTLSSFQMLVTPTARAQRIIFQASASHHVPVNSRYDWCQRSTGPVTTREMQKRPGLSCL